MTSVIFLLFKHISVLVFTQAKTSNEVCGNLYTLLMSTHRPLNLFEYEYVCAFIITVIYSKGSFNQTSLIWTNIVCNKTQIWDTN